MGGVSYSIVAEDETGEGLGSASNSFMITSDTIIAQIGRVNSAIQDFAKEHAVVTGTAERAALITGLDVEQLRELAAKYQDATDSAADMAALEVQLGKEHVSTIEDMEALVKAYDAFGDANQMSASALLYQMAPAFKQFRIDIKDTPQYMDRLTTIFQTTDLSASMFSSQMARMGPQLSSAGLSLEEVTDILMALNEKGITGRRAMSMMTSALKEVSDAAGEDGKKLKELQDEHDGLQEKIDGVKDRWGDLNEKVDAGLVTKKSYANQIFGMRQELGHYQTQITGVDAKMKTLSETTSKNVDAHGILMKSLGLTGEEVATAGAKLEDSEGVTAKFAQAEMDSYTGAEKLNAEIHKQTMSLGPLADGLSGASEAATKLASAYVLLKGLGVIGGAGGAAGGAGGALGGLGGAAGMLGPVGAGLALGGLGVYGLQQAGVLDWLHAQGENLGGWLAQEGRATMQGGGALGATKAVIINSLQADFSTEERFRQFIKQAGKADVDTSKQRGVPTQSAS